MAETRRNSVTLAAILSVMQPSARVFVLHRMGPHELETVGRGTVQELKDLRCIEVCGNNVVECMELTIDEMWAVWLGIYVPILMITIGAKEAD